MLSVESIHSLSTYDFDLPKELIAQFPCKLRDQSRLMIVDRKSSSIEIACFKDLLSLLNPKDSLIFNDTKVIPSRLFGKKKTGAKIEILLVKELEIGEWSALVKSNKTLKDDEEIIFSDEVSCRAYPYLDGMKRLKFSIPNLESFLSQYGHMPLPHYIKRDENSKEDKIRYQTVYAKHKGAIAAPTAGLHFTPEILKKLDENEINRIMVTLHVGLGTFKPVKEENILKHKMHSEELVLDEAASNLLNEREENSKQICVGTTSLRVLESLEQKNGLFYPQKRSTDIFIYPGVKFKYAKHLLTNFHLPKSTLFMLVCAFAGLDLMREVYKKAIEKKFRFFSYGDAMLIL